MPKEPLSYREVGKLVERDLRKIVDKYNLDMDQMIDHFSCFFAKYIMEKSDKRTVDSMNIVHSISRYVIGMQIDEDNGIKNTF